MAFLGVDAFLGVELPEGIAEIPEEEQLRLVGEAVRKHFGEQDGDAAVFGRILGYLYRKTFDETFELTVEGELTGPATRGPVVGSASLWIGKRKLAGGT